MQYDWIPKMTWSLKLNLRTRLYQSLYPIPYFLLSQPWCFPYSSASTGISLPPSAKPWRNRLQEMEWNDLGSSVLSQENGKWFWQSIQHSLKIMHSSDPQWSWRRHSCFWWIGQGKQNLNDAIFIKLTPPYFCEHKRHTVNLSDEEE